VHFTAVFFISAVGLFPAHRVSLFAALVGGCAVIGIAVSLFTTFQLLRHDWTRYLEDHLAYGLLPLICYAALLTAVTMLFAGHSNAMLVLASALLMLLIVNIRNAWDLTLSMVRRHSDGKGAP
jgi:hypothetical protein